MVGWLILGAVLLLVFLLLMMPVGIHAVFRGGLRLSLRLGPFRITLYPRPAKEKKRRRSEGKPQKESKHINRTEDRAEAAERKPEKKHRLPNRQQIIFSLDLLLTVLQRLIRRLRRGIWIDQLDLQVVFGGEDPADVASLYGKAQAAASALFALGDSVMRIGEAHVSLRTDYDAPNTVAEGEVGIQLRFGSALLLLGTVLRGLVQWAVGYRRLGKPQHTTKQAKAA